MIALIWPFSNTLSGLGQKNPAARRQFDRERQAFGGGLQPFLFEPNTVTTHRLIQDQIEQALGRWEPRISVESVDVMADPGDEQAAIVTISYKLVATGVPDQVGLTVRLAG